jgi:hypothetical protein
MYLSSRSSTSFVRAPSFPRRPTPPADLVIALLQVNGLLTIALEWPPIPKIKDLKLYRSYWLRIAFYVWAALVASE